jgi:hypothetical protein
MNVTVDYDNDDSDSAASRSVSATSRRGRDGHSFDPTFSTWEGPAYLLLGFRPLPVPVRDLKWDSARVANFRKFVGEDSIVVCVASSEALDTLTNVGLKFGTRHGDDKLVALINSFALASKVTILLDYFCLADKYYARDYGLKWMLVAEQVCKDDRVSFVLPDNKTKELEKMSDDHFTATKTTDVMCVRDDGSGNKNVLVQSDRADDATREKADSELDYYVSSFVTISKRPMKP